MKIKTPVPHQISQLFGKSTMKWYTDMGMKGHNGIDFACPNGTPILSCLDGFVEYVGQDSAGGIGVYVIHPKEGLKSIYWHMRDYVVKVGDEVKKGDILGVSDNTGMSTGAHLHFGLKKVEKVGKMWQTLNSDNGFRGSIDPFYMLDSVNIVGNWKKGAKGEYVVKIQELLNKKGGMLKVDGIFGNKTLLYVFTFQKQNGLKADGIVGKKTWAKLLE